MNSCTCTFSFWLLDDSGDVTEKKFIPEEDGHKIDNTANETLKDDQKPSKKKNGGNKSEDSDYDGGDIDNTASVIPRDERTPPRKRNGQDRRR